MPPETNPVPKEKPGQRVIIMLRRMIATGEIPAGSKLTEIPTAERLGVSRMPVRLAFRLLEQEGLLVRSGVRGYAVRGFSPVESRGAIEVRGVLEGLAARALAQNGMPKPIQKTLLASLTIGDGLFAKQYFVDTDIESYHAANMRFHQAIISGSGNPAIAKALLRNNSLPFASAAAITLDHSNLAEEFRHLLKAHQQHHEIYQAILAGQADKAFQLMETHAKVTLRDGALLAQETRPTGFDIID